MSTIVGPDTAPDTNGGALKKLRDDAIRTQSEMRNIRQWDRMKRMYMGDFYSTVEMPEWKGKKGNPALWEIVQRFVPVITARKPKFIPAPRRPGDPIDEMMAKMLLAGTDYEWESQGMKRKIAMMAKTAMIFGDAFLYTGVNAGVRKDDLFTKVMTPYEVFPDPNAVSLETAAYCWFKFTVTKRQLASILGPHAKKLLPKIMGGDERGEDDSKFRVVAGDKNDFGMMGTLAASRTATAFDTEIIGPQSRYQYGNEKHYTLWECQLPEADDSEIVKMLDDEEIVLPIKGHGRRVLMIGDKYYHELDTENPFRHGQIPLCQMSVDDFPSEFWSQSYLLPGADRAELVADLDNQISNWIRMGMNSGWLIPNQAGVKPGTIYQFPGIQILYNAPHLPTQIQTPDIPGGVFAHRQNLKRELDDAYGQSAISRGNIDGGITHASGTTVQALQAPTSDRMTCIIDNCESAISRWGYQTMCNKAQFGSDPSWRAIIPNEYKDQPLPWDDQIDPQTGQLVQHDYEDFMPDIKMETGSSLPEDKGGKLTTAFNLNDRGAFGAPGGALASREMLTAAEWPGAEEIVQHVAMEQEAAMQAQAEPPQPDFGGGQNKAFGGQRSPASEQSVQQTGQEVRG